MFLPDNIDLGKSEKYVLNMRIKPDGFSFSIHDPKDKNVYSYLETIFSNETSLSNNIQRIVFDYNFLTNNFNRTNVVIVSPRYELIPTPFYEKQKVEEMFGFTHNNDVSHILTNPQRVLDNELIFDMDESIYLFLYRSLYAPHFYHHSGLLMNYFSKKRTGVRGRVMFIYFHDYFTDVICFGEDERLIHAHTYQKETESNLIYYILSTWQNCGFDQMIDHLFIYGYLPGNDLKNILKDYVSNINDVGNFEQIQDFGEKTQKTPLDISTLSE